MTIYKARPGYCHDHRSTTKITGIAKFTIISNGLYIHTTVAYVWGISDEENTDLQTLIIIHAFTERPLHVDISSCVHSLATACRHQFLRSLTGHYMQTSVLVFTEWPLHADISSCVHGLATTCWHQFLRSLSGHNMQTPVRAFTEWPLHANTNSCAHWLGWNNNNYWGHITELNSDSIIKQIDIIVGQ